MTLTARSWTTTESQTATFVELFFDLVFVFAVTSITGLLRADLTWSGTGRAIVILWLVWWAWTQFTWTLNPADTTHPTVRLITLAATGAAFFMAQAIPDAFGEGGVWFAVAYVTVRVLGLALQAGVVAGTLERRALHTWIAASSVGLAVVVAGGVTSGRWRVGLWGLAVVLDLVSSARAGRGSWRIDASHFVERHGLIVIIALGESLIAAGVALGEVPRTAEFALTTLAAVLAVCALWWLYFGATMRTFEEGLAGAPASELGRVARDAFSWGHLPIVGGIIAFAVAIEEALAHPDDRLATAALVALAGGILLYIAGITFGLWRVGVGAQMRWGVAAALIVLAVLLAARGSGPLVIGAVAVVLVGVGILDGSRRRRNGHPGAEQAASGGPGPM